MRWLPAALAVAVASLWGAGAAQAAAPPNDDYAAGAPLAVGQQVQGNNLEATSEPGEKTPPSTSFTSEGCLSFDEAPQCGSSVWYVLEPSQSGEYTIETCDMGTDLPAGLAVYSGASVATAVLLDYSFGLVEGCAGFGGNGTGSRVTVALTAGTAYHVGVYGLFADEGSYYLRDYAGPPIAGPSPDTASNFASSILASAGLGAGARSGPRHSPSFALLSSPPGAQFECSLDGGAYSPCEQVISYEGLAPGSSHTFRARANVHGAIDPTPLIEPFTLDDTAPETFIAGPSGPTSSQEASWMVSSSERLFRGRSDCTFDSMPQFRFCGASYPEPYKQLCQGPHDFSASAVDRAGNVDPTPAEAHIDVTTGPLCAPPTLEQSFVAQYPTQLIFALKTDPKGAGGRIDIEYGPTSAYGMNAPPTGVQPDHTTEVVGISYLQPATEYHYRVTLTTPFGSATTGDLTASTKPLKQPLPGIVYGTPTTQPYAASVPAIIDPQTEGVDASIFVQREAPVELSSPRVSFPEFIDSFGGPRTATFDITDLEPQTTYHYRVSATQPDGNFVLGPEATFTTPPLKSPVTPVKGHFQLSKDDVRIGKLTRRSKKVSVRVRDLPAGTLVEVGLSARKRRAAGRGRASVNGSAVLKIKFSKRFRKALHDKHLKAVRFKVTALPPGDTPSSVVLKRRLGR